jgi:hypothetical protein
MGHLPSATIPWDQSPTAEELDDGVDVARVERLCFS